MTDQDQSQNRAVWMDIPVADLSRASEFYAAVLNIKVTQETSEGYSFAVLEHQEGNGGCLVLNPEGISKDGGLLVYMNCEGRIREAVELAQAKGGDVIELVHNIGPHGFRALVHDSEGNRIALHSMVDA